MNKQLAHTVINGLNRQPALLSLAYASMLSESIRMIASSDANDEEAGVIKRNDNLISAYGYSPSGEKKPFAYADGIAFIPVTGMLINRCSWSWSFATGYNFIRNQLNAALADDDVVGIVFDCDSGGGMVAGCFELCDDIYKSREIKPSVAVVDAASYSACYAIASSASRIVVTPSAGIGSVGVVAMHVDLSKMLDENGIKVTFIYSGEHKVDFNQYQSLKPSVKASMQKSVDATRESFVALVARNRGLDTKVVYDTEAQCYSAEEALALGLVDAIAPPIEAVGAFINELSGSETDQEITMSKVLTGAESITATAATAAAQAAAPVVTANAQTVADTASQTVDASTERSAERQRISAITSHADASARPRLAQHLAFNTDMSVEAAGKILAAAAPEATQAAAASSAFEAAMATSPHPNVGVSESASEGGELTAAQRILKSHALATGTAG